MRLLAVIFILAMLTGCAAIAVSAIGGAIGQITADTIEKKFPEKKQ